MLVVSFFIIQEQNNLIWSQFSLRNILLIYTTIHLKVWVETVEYRCIIFMLDYLFFIIQKCIDKFWSVFLKQQITGESLWRGCQYKMCIYIPKVITTVIAISLSAFPGSSLNTHHTHTCSLQPHSEDLTHASSR